jgi:hypothetical protein
MKEYGRAFQCEPCRQTIIFFAVSDASPYIAAGACFRRRNARPRPSSTHDRGPVSPSDCAGHDAARQTRQRTDGAR